MASTMQKPWLPLEPDRASILRSCSGPLDAMGRGDVPAVVFRKALSPDSCRRIVDRLIEREHLYDPARPVPEKFLERSIPEGYQKNRTQTAEKSWRDDGSTPRRRIDVGTSLGNLGFDKEKFLAHSAETHRLFAHLFDGLENPVELLYDRLRDLACGRQVVTAREPDGRLYGPAIVLAHYGGYTYKPHFDSVRHRENRREYAVYEFEHQFAGVLVLQNTEKDGQTAQSTLHHCLWTPEVDPHLADDTFHAYAAERGLQQATIHLDPGDLYFFNTRLIHEVPGVEGNHPRIVLATFIGYSSDRDALYVWS